MATLNHLNRRPSQHSNRKAPVQAEGVTRRTQDSHPSGRKDSLRNNHLLALMKMHSQLRASRRNRPDSATNAISTPNRHKISSRSLVPISRSTLSNLRLRPSSFLATQLRRLQISLSSRQPPQTFYQSPLRKLEHPQTPFRKK